MIVDDASESQARVALTNFYGMDTTRDHLCSLIRKWHNLIEAAVDAKTSDGFLLRVFPVAFTARTKSQLRATTYAKRSQIKQIRKIMHNVIVREVGKSTLKDLVDKLIKEKIPVDITQKAKKIFPIENCIIRKVKTVKRPRFDMTQLLSMQSDIGAAEKTVEETKENDNLVK